MSKSWEGGENWLCGKKKKKKNEVSSPLLSRSFVTTTLFQHDVGPWPLVTCLAKTPVGEWCLHLLQCKALHVHNFEDWLFLRCCFIYVGLAVCNMLVEQLLSEIFDVNSSPSCR